MDNEKLIHNFLFLPTISKSPQHFQGFVFRQIIFKNLLFLKFKCCCQTDYYLKKTREEAFLGVDITFLKEPTSQHILLSTWLRPRNFRRVTRLCLHKIAKLFPNI